MTSSEPDICTAEAARWLQTFSDCLERRDVEAAMALFSQTSYWRDLIAFTWNIKTLEGADQIRAMLKARVAEVAPSKWQLDGETAEKGGALEAWFTFATSVGKGRGLLRLKDGYCWNLFTALFDLTGFEEKRGYRRELGTEHGAKPGRRSWLDDKTDHQHTFGYAEQPYCLIIGGGQGGMHWQRV